MKQYFIQKMIEKNNGKYEPLNSWKTDESIRDYFEQIAPLLHINELSDWYRISRLQIVDMKGIYSYISYIGILLNIDIFSLKLLKFSKVEVCLIDLTLLVKH